MGSFLRVWLKTSSKICDHYIVTVLTLSILFGQVYLIANFCCSFTHQYLQSQFSFETSEPCHMKKRPFSLFLSSRNFKNMRAATCLCFSLELLSDALHVCANNKGPAGISQVNRLTWTPAVCLCNKGHYVWHGSSIMLLSLAVFFLNLSY